MAKCYTCGSTDSLCVHSLAHTIGILIQNSIYSLNITFSEFVELFDACPNNYVFTNNEKFTVLQKSKEIINENQVICLESLKVKNMVKKS